MSQGVDFDLTDGQRVALNLIYEPFRDGGEWAQQRYVEKALRRHGLSLDSVFEGLPPGLVVPDPTTAHFYVRPEDEIALTIAGMSVCTGSRQDIELFLRSLQFFVGLEDSYSPPPTGGSPLYVGTTELVSRLGLTSAEAARVYKLTRHERRLFGSGGGNPDQWQFELTPDIQRFAGVTTLEQYLETRVVPRPYRKAEVDFGEFLPSQGLPRLPAFVAEHESGEHAPATSTTQHAARWRGLRVINRVLEHPLIAGIVGAVVAGIILASIYGH